MRFDSRQIVSGKTGAIHAWHLLLAMAYNLKRLAKLVVDRRMVTQI